VFTAFGPDEGMQVYGRGLRRRLPPMVGGDGRRVRLAYSLMMSLPGTPTLFYGEEIGMGENLDLPGRMAVRTPMQWQAGEMGGFSTAKKADEHCAVDSSKSSAATRSPNSAATPMRAPPQPNSRTSNTPCPKRKSNSPNEIRNSPPPPNQPRTHRPAQPGRTQPRPRT
jgi:glycosidase